VTVRVITVDAAIRIHDGIIAQSGGRPSTAQRGLLESALLRPYATFMGQDLYPGVLEKASILAYGVARNHAFVDGNKRTAAVLLITFLRINGFDLSATDAEIEEIFVGVGDGSVTPATLLEWVHDHSAPYNGSLGAPP